MKPFVRRAKADDDIQTAVEYFLFKAPEHALAFVDAVEQACRHIQRHPGSGSPRYGHELDLPELRFWRCQRFPFLVFYVERSDSIEIWRILHSQQDIPATLRSEDG